MNGWNEVSATEEVACPGGPQQVRAEIERLALRMYEETFLRLRHADLRGVVKHRITALYGPPMARPELMLVSFQGGGGDSSPSRPTWPERFRYLDSEFDFGRALRSQFREAGLYETLATRTVAMAACFPEAPASQSSRWMAKRGPRADWRVVSSNWVRRMVSAMRPPRGAGVREEGESGDGTGQSLERRSIRFPTLESFRTR